MTKTKKAGICVFLVAFALGLNVTGISPILGVLNEKYQHFGTSVVQLLQTLPYLLIMFGSLLLGWLSVRISKKSIALTGLLLVGIFGTAPFFWDNFYLLFLSRLLIGFGYGIINPLNTAIVAELFEEEERAGFMGLHVVGMGAGAIVGNMLGGILSAWGYKYFFLIYLVAFIGALGIWVMLPNMKVSGTAKAKPAKLNLKVYALSAASFFHLLLINAFSMNIGIYLLKNITADTAMAGVAMTVNAVAALVMGLFFAVLSKKMGTRTLPLAIFSAAAGYLMLLLIPGYPGVYLGSVLCGICQSCFSAGLALMISLSVEKEAVAKASGVSSVFGSIGGLLAPIALGNTALHVLGENTPENQFRIAFVGMLILGVVLYLAIARKPEKH